MQILLNNHYMPKKPSLSEIEQKLIVSHLGKGQKIPEIAKNSKRDVRTIKKFLKIQKKPKRKDKNVKRVVSPRDIRKIERQLCKTPFETSKNIFEKAALSVSSRSSRCRILKEISKN